MPWIWYQQRNQWSSWVHYIWKCNLRKMRWKTNSNPWYCKNMVRKNEWLLRKCKKNYQQESQELSTLVPYWFNFHLDMVRFLSARLLVTIGTAGTGRRLLPIVRFSVWKKLQVVYRMNNMLLAILGRIWGLRGKKAFLHFCWYIYLPSSVFECVDAVLNLLVDALPLLFLFSNNVL